VVQALEAEESAAHDGKGEDLVVEDSDGNGSI
ncbi:hypothetical protein A2U01_0116156, partial [Trifolium medium]|nr:hypothetical protein [Trifolium medium]